MEILKKTQVLLLSLCLLLQVACASSPHISDTELQRNVEIALSGASDDLPQRIQVDVSSGVVRVTGTLSCETCGGNVTPGQNGTIQQSLGAVIRTVPGVKDVEFSFDSV